MPLLQSNHPDSERKCTLCYHRITASLSPPAWRSVRRRPEYSADLKNPQPNDPIQKFYQNNRVQTLKRNHGGSESVA